MIHKGWGKGKSAKHLLTAQLRFTNSRHPVTEIFGPLGEKLTFPLQCSIQYDMYLHPGTLSTRGYATGLHKLLNHKYWKLESVKTTDG